MLDISDLCGDIVWSYMEMLTPPPTTIPTTTMRCHLDTRNWVSPAMQANPIVGYCTIANHDAMGLALYLGIAQVSFACANTSHKSANTNVHVASYTV